jgi:simple sugar transport system ATP-binding protein
VRLKGVEIAPRSAKAAIDAGIATVYQEVNLLPNLSVAQNLYLGRQPTRFGVVQEGEMRRRASVLLAGFGLHIDVAAPLGDYSVAVQHVVAIARAVDLSARVLILDEPTSSLDRHEVEILFRVMRQLAARGIGIVFVSHFLDQVYEISDRITVLRNGHLIGSRDTATLPRLELIRMMLGHGLRNQARPPGASGARSAELRRLWQGRPCRAVRSPRCATAVVGLADCRSAEPKRRGWCSASNAPIPGRPGQACRCAAVAARHVARFGYCPEGARPSIVADRRARYRAALQPARPVPAAFAQQQDDRHALHKAIGHPPARRNGRSGCSPAATSRKCCWRGGSPPRRACWCSTSRHRCRRPYRISPDPRVCDDGLALLVISSELDEIVTYSDRVIVLATAPLSINCRGCH